MIACYTAFGQIRVKISLVEPVDVIEIKRTEEDNFSTMAHPNPNYETKKKAMGVFKFWV